MGNAEYMGTRSPSSVVSEGLTCLLVIRKYKTHTQKASEWLTAGTIASSLLCATCTTLTTLVSWTRTTSSAWPSATPSSRPRASGTRACTKRTRKSCPTCGTKSQTSLTSTRMAKYQLKSSIRVLKCLAKARPTQNSPKLSNFSSIARSEQLM